MDKFIKRIQTRANRQGLSVSKQVVREVYQSVVINLAQPTEIEISAVIEKLKSQSSAQEPITQELTTSEEKNLGTIEITSDTHPDLWETLQPPTEPQLFDTEPTKENLRNGLSTTTHQIEQIEETLPEKKVTLTLEVTPDIWKPLESSTGTTSEQSEEEVQPEEIKILEEGATEEKVGNALAKTDPTSAMSSASSVTQSQIQQAVEQRFANQPAEIKSQVVQYATESTFSSAQELEQMLEQLRQVELTVMLQIINTHNTQRLQTLTTFKEVLDSAEQKRKDESEAFFSQFEKQLATFKTAYGVR
jgi:hypothetical protein